MKSLLKNISLLTLSELIEKMVIFLLFIYMGRVLPVTEFGYLNYILSVLSYFVIFIDLGLPQLATRELAAHIALKTPLFQLILMLKMALFVMVAIVWNVYIYLYQKDHYMLGLFLSLYLFARVIDIYWYLQAQHKFTTIAKLKIAKAVLLSSAFVAIYLYPLLEVYLLILVVSLLLPFLYYMIRSGLAGIILNSHNFYYLLKNTNKAKVFIYKSIPLIVSTFLILMYYNLDTVLIKYYIDYDAVARYNAAYKIIFAFIVVRSIFTSVIFPRMSQAKLEWREDKLFLGIGVFISVVIALIGFFFAEEILSVIYGGKYDSSATVFTVLSLTASVLWVNLFPPTFFIAIKRDTFYMKVHFLTAGMNLVGNIIMIPKYGIVGAAVATLLADIVSLIIFGVAYFKLKTEKGQS